MYEGERIHQLPAEQIAALFGADAVLYVTIKQWDAQYVVISTTVTVDFDYRMVSKNGQEIWKEQSKFTYTPQNNSGSLLGALIAAAITRAKPNYIPLTKQANNQVFILGENAIPNGPYAPRGAR